MLIFISFDLELILELADRHGFLGRITAIRLYQNKYGKASLIGAVCGLLDSQKNCFSEIMTPTNFLVNLRGKKMSFKC